MSVLHSILVARSTAMRTLTARSWPSGTTFGPDDIVIDGLSLTRRVEGEDGPVVCIGHAPRIDGRHPEESGTPLRTVVLTRVEYIVPMLRRHHRQFWPNCDLDGALPVPEEIRLIGRPARGRLRPWELHPLRQGAATGTARLPEDLHPGDVLAIPCIGLVTPEELRG